MGILKRYKAEYPFDALIMVGKGKARTQKRIKFTPFFDTDDDEIHLEIERSGYLDTGRIRVIRVQKVEEPKEEGPKGPEDVEDISRVHPSTLFKWAKERGYPENGSRKKKDLLEFFLSQEE
jgi:hypothetical protein